jgi:transposase-like protein
MTAISYRYCHFPPVIIQHAVWLYACFTLSLRDIEELLAERGIQVSCESIRRWVARFGPEIGRRLRQHRPRAHSQWHLDEMFVSMDGKLMDLWRAIDQNGEILDVLVQAERDKRAALKLMRNLLKKNGFAPRTIVGDKLRSYAAAFRDLGLTARHHPARLRTGGESNTMRKIALLIVTAAVAVAVAAPAGAVVSFDGKSTSFHTVTAVPLPLASAPILTGTIAKGKKTSVLKIDAMVTSENMAPALPWTLNAFVDVNGIAVDPTLATPPFGAVQDCASSAVPFGGPANGCTVSGTWIFDIDAAETASPGCCYTLPLTVNLSAGPGLNLGIAGFPTSASLSVKMEKKK